MLESDYSGLQTFFRALQWLKDFEKNGEKLYLKLKFLNFLDFDLPESQTDDSEAPISDAKIARLFTRLWQSRAETEEDQRFNPPSQLLHHGFKESETYSTQNKPSM